ncbi:hypothetical protein [Burkholderia cepacia]|uniref:hypothetical protein n=1 Tax=Burkholderia cepacia TaxID=292 RepID=UPI00158D40E7|nr:hypothetical protein [Burkholderia cepacia]
MHQHLVIQPIHRTHRQQPAATAPGQRAGSQHHVVSRLRRRLSHALHCFAMHNTYALRSLEHARTERHGTAMARHAQPQAHADVLGHVRAKRLRLGVRQDDLQQLAPSSVPMLGGNNRRAGDIGYQFTCVRSTLQNLSHRIAAIEHVSKHRDCVIAGPGYMLCEEVGDYRIAFVFPAAPTKPIRDLLTHCGFVFDTHRSRNGHATWGRKRTPTAIMVAQRLLPELGALMKPLTPVVWSKHTATSRPRTTALDGTTLLCEVIV